MFAVHQKKIAERNFGGCRAEEWLDVMYAVLQCLDLESEKQEPNARVGLNFDFNVVRLWFYQVNH